MKRKATFWRTMAVAAALAIPAGSADALTVDWAVHDSVEAGANVLIGTGTPIFDVFTFTLASAALVQGSAISLEGIPVFDITGGLVELFNNDGDLDFTNDSIVGSFAFDALQIGNTFGVLAPGAYYYRVTGTVSNLAGSYLIGSDISVVPVPPTLLLLGTGLLGLAGLRRRHRTV